MSYVWARPEEDWNSLEIYPGTLGTSGEYFSVRWEKELPVDKVGSLKVGDEVNIYDATNFETVIVSKAEGNTLTVSELKSSYEKGAYVVRSTVTTDRENKKYKRVPYTVYNVTARVV